MCACLRQRLNVDPTHLAITDVGHVTGWIIGFTERQNSNGNVLPIPPPLPSAPLFTRHSVSLSACGSNQNHPLIDYLQAQRKGPNGLDIKSPLQLFLSVFSEHLC